MKVKMWRRCPDVFQWWETKRPLDRLSLPTVQSSQRETWGMQEVRLCERAAVENNCEGVVPSPILAKKPRSFYFYYGEQQFHHLSRCCAQDYDGCFLLFLKILSRVLDINKTVVFDCYLSPFLSRCSAVRTLSVRTRLYCFAAEYQVHPAGTTSPRSLKIMSESAEFRFLFV